MTAKSHCRGWEIKYENERWVFSDNNEPCKTDNRRPCKRCNRFPTKEGHDACLGELPGVISACCGHGIKEPYIKYKS